MWRQASDAGFGESGGEDGVPPAVPQSGPHLGSCSETHVTRSCESAPHEAKAGRRMLSGSSPIRHSAELTRRCAEIPAGRPSQG